MTSGGNTENNLKAFGISCSSLRINISCNSSAVRMPLPSSKPISSTITAKKVRNLLSSALLADESVPNVVSYYKCKQGNFRVNVISRSS